jgi:hypothetical protein
MIRNPKQAESNLFDCIPQIGPCPMGCNQCFYNRPGAFYLPIDQPSIPDPAEVGDGIVRMNCGNDSNNERELVIETAKQYKHAFFNTSLPCFDFPGPVVLTANRKEEIAEAYLYPYWHREGWMSPAKNLMFVRLRVSPTNLELVAKAAAAWTQAQVPVVLTFMAYYTCEPCVPDDILKVVPVCYEWKVRHINSYWCPTLAFIRYVLNQHASNRLVSYCGSLEGSYCRLCRNCETHYIQTCKRLRGE